MYERLWLSRRNESLEDLEKLFPHPTTMTRKELPAGLHGALRQSSASSIGSLIILFVFGEEGIG